MDVRTMQRRSKAGFTLAELLIVVAIMAVLTAVAVPVFSTQLEKARESADLTTISNAYSEITVALVDGSLVRNNDKIKVSGQTTGDSDYATLTRTGTGSTAKMTITVTGLPLSQNIAGWYTADHKVGGYDLADIVDVEKSNFSSAADKRMTVVYTFTNSSRTTTSTTATTNFVLTEVKATRTK